MVRWLRWLDGPLISFWQPVLHPLTSPRPPSPQYALHHQPNRTIPNHDTPNYICLSWASHHSMHYIISPPLGSPHPLGQTILCFLGFPRWTHTTIIIVVCIITVEEYLRCASGWSSFPEDARANHLPLNYVHSISPTMHCVYHPLCFIALHITHNYNALC